ncbi:unnamed protein product [Caretta caretta]
MANGKKKFLNLLIYILPGSKSYGNRCSCQGLAENSQPACDFNEDRESAIYETLKVETMEDKPSDEIACY